jgi:PAS domain S-box-containing protein
MTSDATVTVLLDALFAKGNAGLCLFDADGVVSRVKGSAVTWAPAPGARIEEAPMFVGLMDAIRSTRQGGETLTLASLAIGGIDAPAVDIDIMWLAPIACYAAMARSAAARVGDQQAASQIVRDNRLLQEKVRQQQARIAEQAEMMALFIRHTPAAVAMLDAEGRIVMASERWKQEHGDPALARQGVETESPLTWPGVLDRLRLAMEGGVPSTSIEKSMARGRPIWKRLAQAPWRGADRTIGGAVLFSEDVTDAMRKAENLRARVEDLHKLGAEMDDLGNAISNDLRAPLRQIDFYSRFLLDADHPGLDRASLDYLAQIRASAERVDRMMSALKRYMRLSERDLLLSRFDIGEAMATATNKARDGLNAARVHVVMRETLSVEGDIALLSGLFERLIDNAVKYAGAGATIVVDCFEEPDGLLVRFADDGPGIAPHLRRRAFGFFERLDAPAFIPGEGMGLAECRKIVDLHGGGMTLDPDYDAGLRALIALPRFARRGAPRRP